MFKFLIWLILIYLIARFVLRVYGRTLLGMFVNRLAKRMEQDMRNREQNYRQYQEPGAFRRSVHIDNEIQVTESVQKSTKNPPKVQDFAEDIDFVEVRE